jgi:hypothetical protein
MLAGLMAAPGGARASTVPTSTTRPASPGGIGIRILQAPVSLESDPRARVYIIDHLNPGSTIERAIGVSNTTTSLQSVSLYAGGAQVVANDAFLPGPDNALSSWITVRPSTVDLKPGTSQTAEVTIQVPATAPSLESYAVVWAQVEKPGRVVNQVNRVGIRVYLDVGPGGDPPTMFTLGPLSVTESHNRPVISSTVDDTGQRAIDIRGTLAMKSLQGSVTAGPYQLDRNLTIPPHASGVVTVSIDAQLPAGDWKASLQVTADTVTQTRSAEIALRDGAALKPPASSRPSYMPYLIGGAVALVALGAGGGVIYRRRSKRMALQHAKHERTTPDPSRPTPT